MADFINTIDALGDDAVFDSIINKTVTEFKDDKVTSMRTYALYGCSNLETVDLTNVTTVGKYAFSECKSLVNVSLPALKTSNNQLFQNCTSLESVSLPEYTGALNYTFMGCSALKSVDFPKATEVGNTFLGGSAVTHLRLPAVAKAGNNAFRECAKLKQVDLPVCTQLGAYALYNLPNLETVILRSSTVCSVADSTTLSLPNGPYTSLKIYVPSALVDSYKVANNLTTYANQLRKLEEWTVDGTVTGELNLNQHMVRFFDEDGTLLSYVIVPTGSTAVNTGDEPVKEGDYAFTGWNPAPTNVTADMDCYAKFKSTAPASKQIVERTISEYVNYSVESIGTSAFHGCRNLTSVDFHSATSIGDYAFYNCESLVTVILRSPTMVTLANVRAFANTPIVSGTGHVYVPSALADNYKAAFGADVIRAIEDYPEICGGE